MTLRRVLVTGANKGIGLALVRRCLADHHDTFCILGCRSRSRGDAAVSALLAEEPAWKERVMVLELDTASTESVRAAAARVVSLFGASPPPLYGLVNNAGIAAGAMEDVLNVNVRGVRRVDTAFAPLLSSRLVQMSSGVGPMTVSKCSDARKALLLDPNVTWEQIDSLMSEVVAYPNGANDFEANGLGKASMGGYGLSKALLNAYLHVSAREHTHLKVNACSPGLIATDLFTDFSPWWLPKAIGRFLVMFLMPRLMGAKTTDEGTVSAMHLLFCERLEGNGRFYGSDALRSPLDVYRKAGSPAYGGP